MSGHVDAHHHVWDLAVRDQPWVTGEAMAPIRRTFGVDDLAPHTRAAGVEATVLVQTLPSVVDTRDLLATAASYDLVAGVVGWVDLTAPTVAADLASLRETRGGDLLRGIRHLVQDEPDPQWLCREDVRRGLAAVGEAGLRYDLLTTPAQLPAAVATVRALPEVSFVLDHCSKPPIAAGESEPWASQVRALADSPNVVCKLSGLVTEAGRARWTPSDLRPYVDVVLEAFGPQRLLFGSDWPVCLLASSYARWFETACALLDGLSSDERDAVLGDAARRVYGLA
ncbi:MAG: amidohydrolase family protein [Actinomycetes bacterium]